MTAKHDLERRLADYYASEAPVRAPDRVLATALADIESTPQRRVLGRVPWRIPDMNTYARLAIAAVVVLAVGAVGLAVLRPGSNAPGGAGSSPSPPVSPSASQSPTASASPAPAAYVPPDLTETFTSDVHGISFSYPTGWQTQAATQPWTSPSHPLFTDPAGDFAIDSTRGDHLFIMTASQPLDGRTAATWAAGILEGCGSPTPVVVDGADGLIGAGCDVAAVWTADRRYVVWLYVSGDDLELRRFDSRAWLEEVLATVRLHPEDALDTVP